MATQSVRKLFSPFKLGDLTFPNKFVMASLTRCRADIKTLVPNDLHVEYYSQRASAGLIMSEASPIAQNGQAFLGAGAIYTPEQVKGWKRVTDAVHRKGGKIFLQIWHAGRSAHPELVGAQNIGPSAIAIRGEVMPGLEHVVPKEMTKEDIKMVREQFRQGALNAQQAGFDGVELHGANGYLVDEFLRDGSNHRTDEYGGSVENRARFCLEVMDVLGGVFGRERTGIKLSPVVRYQDMYDSNPLKTYSYLLTRLDKKGFGFVQLVESIGEKNTFPEYVSPQVQMPEVCKALRPYFKGIIMINNNQTPVTAAKAIEKGYADVASFGRYFISNPDFVERVKNGYPYSNWDTKTFYAGGAKGYVDYSFYKPEKGSLKEEESKPIIREQIS